MHLLSCWIVSHHVREWRIGGERRRVGARLAICRCLLIPKIGHLSSPSELVYLVR